MLAFYMVLDTDTFQTSQRKQDPNEGPSTMVRTETNVMMQDFQLQRESHIDDKYG